MALRHFDVLLIGGGVAAVRCARTLRRLGFAGSIGLVGDEALPPYNRPPLSKELLRGEVPIDLVLAEPMGWYERRGVDLLLGSPATSLDPDQRVAELADGRRLGFHQCLLATGAQPRTLAVPGPGEPRYLRTLADAEAIRADARAGARAAIIGGGFIGVEVAASLAERGMRVTVHERASSLWAGGIGSVAAEWARASLEQAGARVQLGSAVLSVADLGASELVVAGIGVTPRTRLAWAAGIDVDDGVLVDERQATSATGIYAAGDVARARGGTRVEHWHAAREGGERAAAAMLGAPVPSHRAAWVYSEFAGHRLDVLGLAEPDDEQVAVRPGVVAFLGSERLTRVVLMDGAAPLEVVRELVERGASLCDLEAVA
jgi:NADPH-dependent 2,4-dienoyl-CoA reductase/sulfur reductase-like enzyme